MADEKRVFRSCLNLSGIFLYFFYRLKTVKPLCFLYRFNITDTGFIGIKEASRNLYHKNNYASFSTKKLVLSLTPTLSIGEGAGIVKKHRKHTVFYRIKEV